MGEFPLGWERPRSLPQQPDRFAPTGSRDSTDEALAASVLLELQVEAGQPSDHPVKAALPLGTSLLEPLANLRDVGQHLRTDLATVGDKYHDAGTNDFLTGLMEQHEKMAWMLRACLDEK